VVKKMSAIEKNAKLIHLSMEQSAKLQEINDTVLDNGGYTNVSQLIREAIDILINNYRDAVIQKYMPIKLKDRFKSR